MKMRRPYLGFLRRRTCVVPTWRGWLLLVCLAVPAAIVVMRGAYPFLAVNDPLPGGILVVEGWTADYAMEAAMAEFEAHHYEALCVTGGAIEKGSPLAEYKSCANLGEFTLEKMGLDPNLVHAVPADEVRADRTYASAIALKKWLRNHHLGASKLNLVSVGAHSRRSRMLFQKAFGAETRVGIIAVEDRQFVSKRWWVSSAGVRSVTSEVIAYLYARFLFRPPAE